MQLDLGLIFSDLGLNPAGFRDNQVGFRVKSGLI